MLRAYDESLGTMLHAPAPEAPHPPRPPPPPRPPAGAGGARGGRCRPDTTHPRCPRARGSRLARARSRSAPPCQAVHATSGSTHIHNNNIIACAWVGVGGGWAVERGRRERRCGGHRGPCMQRGVQAHQRQPKRNSIKRGMPARHRQARSNQPQPQQARKVNEGQPLASEGALTGCV